VSGLHGFMKVITVWECEYPLRFSFITLENQCDKLPRPQTRHPEPVRLSNFLLFDGLFVMSLLHSFIIGKIYTNLFSKNS